MMQLLRARPRKLGLGRSS